MDYKEMAQGLKSAQEQTLAEVKSLKDALAAKEQEINNLDASIKEQQDAINELKAMRKNNENPTFGQAFRDAFYAQKDAISAFVKDKKERFSLSVELKTATAVGTNHITSSSLSVQGDGTIYGAVPVTNAFILAFGLKTRTANKLSWVEATTESGADYIGELPQSHPLSDVTFVEKQRAYGKVGTKMTISTEVEDWFEQIYQYCVTEGARLVDAKIDAEIYGGNGSDNTNPTHIYGIKGAATAFSALNAGGVEKANIADVIIDSAEQIAKEGFAANVAFVTWAGYAALKEVKTTTGEYLFDRAMGMLNGIKVMPTARLSTGEIIVADTTCAEVYAGNSYELEFLRNGEVDGYNVYFRKAAQVKVPASKAKGIIYVASTTTAIAALLKSE